MTVIFWCSKKLKMPWLSPFKEYVSKIPMQSLGLKFCYSFPSALAPAWGNTWFVCRLCLTNSTLHTCNRGTFFLGFADRQKETDLSFSISWVRGPSRYGLIEGCDFDLKLVFKITFRHIFNFGMKLGLVLTCGLKCGLSEKTTVEVVVRVHPPGAKKLFVTGTGRTLDLSIP